MQKETEIAFEVKVEPAARGEVVPRSAPGGCIVGTDGVLYIMFQFMAHHLRVGIAAAFVGTAEGVGPSAEMQHLGVIGGMQGDKAVKMECQFVVGGVGVEEAQLLFVQSALQWDLLIFLLAAYLGGVLTIVYQRLLQVVYMGDLQCVNPHFVVFGREVVLPIGQSCLLQHAASVDHAGVAHHAVEEQPYLQCIAFLGEEHDGVDVAELVDGGAADAHVGTCGEQRHLSLQFGGFPSVVVVHAGDERSLHHGEGAVEGGYEPHIVRVVDASHTRVGVRVGDSYRAVGGTVVAYPQFEIAVGLSQHAVDGLSQVAFAIVYGQDDGY